MEWVAIVTLLALLEYLVIMLLVGRARGRYEIEAPATSGHEVFERYFRVQQNTIEQLVIFIPSLWAFGYFLNPVAAAGIGVVFLIGRLLYLRGYVSDPRRRGLGFGIGFLANVVLLLGGLGAALVVVFA